MSPAMINDSHTAEPATAPASPSSTKMPAPIIPPRPIRTADHKLIFLSCATANLKSFDRGSQLNHGQMPYVTTLAAIQKDPTSTAASCRHLRDGRSRRDNLL